MMRLALAIIATEAITEILVESRLFERPRQWLAAQHDLLGRACAMRVVHQRMGRIVCLCDGAPKPRDCANALCHSASGQLCA